MAELKEYIPKPETDYERAKRIYEESKYTYDMKILSGELSGEEKQAWERGLEFERKAVELLKPSSCVIS